MGGLLKEILSEEEVKSLEDIWEKLNSAKNAGSLEFHYDHGGVLSLAKLHRFLGIK